MSSQINVSNDTQNSCRDAYQKENFELYAPWHEMCGEPTASEFGTVDIAMHDNLLWSIPTALNRDGQSFAIQSVTRDEIVDRLDQDDNDHLDADDFKTADGSSLTYADLLYIRDGLAKLNGIFNRHQQDFSDYFANAIDFAGYDSPYDLGVEIEYAGVQHRQLNSNVSTSLGQYLTCSALTNEAFPFLQMSTDTFFKTAFENCPEAKANYLAYLEHEKKAWENQCDGLKEESNRRCYEDDR